MYRRLRALARRFVGGLRRPAAQGSAVPKEVHLGGSHSEKGSIWDQSLDQYIHQGFKLYWETLDVVRDYQHTLIAGQAGVDPISYAIELICNEIGTSDLRALSLGCQEESSPEMVLARASIFKTIHVTDLSGRLLDRQRAKAEAEGFTNITYTPQDLNAVELEPNSYDVIWSAGTIHHLERLEHVFAQVNRALTPRGLFIMREYIGPNRLQFPDEHLAHVNEILRLLPERLRRRHDGRVKDKERRPRVSDLVAHDPSEAIRSQDIVTTLSDALAVVRHVETGGTLLAPLLNEIASNFEITPEGVAVLPLLIQIEKMLIETNVLPSYYCFTEARQRP